MEVLIRVELRRTVQTSCYVKEAGHKRPRAAGSTYASQRPSCLEQADPQREREEAGPGGAGEGGASRSFLGFFSQ